MRMALVVAGLLLAAVAATYARYQSLHPCDWMEQDLAAHYDLPLIVLQARIRAGFLLQGITDPDAADCLFEWWDLRSQGLPNGS